MTAPLLGGEGGGLPSGLAEGVQGRHGPAALGSVVHAAGGGGGGGSSVGRRLPSVRRGSGVGGSGPCKGSAVTPLLISPPYWFSAVLLVWRLRMLGGGLSGAVLEGQGSRDLGGKRLAGQMGPAQCLGSPVCPGAAIVAVHHTPDRASAAHRPGTWITVQGGCPLPCPLRCGRQGGGRARRVMARWGRRDPVCRPGRWCRGGGGCRATLRALHRNMFGCRLPGRPRGPFSSGRPGVRGRRGQCEGSGGLVFSGSVSFAVRTRVPGTAGARHAHRPRMSWRAGPFGGGAVIRLRRSLPAWGGTSGRWSATPPAFCVCNPWFGPSPGLRCHLRLRFCRALGCGGGRFLGRYHQCIISPCAIGTPKQLSPPLCR